MIRYLLTFFFLKIRLPHRFFVLRNLKMDSTTNFWSRWPWNFATMPRGKRVGLRYLLQHINHTLLMHYYQRRFGCWKKKKSGFPLSGARVTMQQSRIWSQKACLWVAYGIVIIWMRGERMHFEILVEDRSGKKALDILVPKIIGMLHTFKVHSYKGIGHIPRNMKDTDDVSKKSTCLPYFQCVIIYNYKLDKYEIQNPGSTIDRT